MPEIYGDQVQPCRQQRDEQQLFKPHTRVFKLGCGERIAGGKSISTRRGYSNSAATRLHMQTLGRGVTH
jgi:hypothetical protein